MKINLQSIFIILSVLTLLSSCGGGKKNLDSSLAFGANQLSTDERSLTNDERTIATRICYAYQSKSKNFRTSEFLNKSMSFSNEEINCSNFKTTKKSIATLRIDVDNILYFSNQFETGEMSTFKVQTDTYGYLAQLCEKIKLNQTISNTAYVGNVKIQIKFTRDGLDSYVLKFFNKVGSDYQIESQEIFKIRTQFNFVFGQILGMDEFYTKEKICPDKKTIFTSKTNFLSRY